MKLDVENFVKQCQICQQAKHEHTHPARLLQQLPIPQGAWQDLSMDFVEGLLTSENSNAILVVVDWFSKYSHFIPLKHPFTAPSVARLVPDHVVKLHGMPRSIVSDRDKVFSSSFWKTLFSLSDTKLLMSIAYHLQMTVRQSRLTNAWRCTCVVRCMTLPRNGGPGSHWQSYGTTALTTLHWGALLLKHSMGMRPIVVLCFLWLISLLPLWWNSCRRERII